MQKILVTGGAGFIGASFLKHLIYGNGGSSSGLEIRVFDLLTYAGRANIEDTNFRSLLSHLRFTHGDITLGWRPSPDIWGQFDEVVEWYLQNRAWWAPLLEASESIYREVAR